MKKVEDLSDETVPEPGAGVLHVRGAYKFKQFRPRAWEQTLIGLVLGGLWPSSSSGWCSSST
eukprot:12743214-Prorocentrum_lima.AAC.1